MTVRMFLWWLGTAGVLSAAADAQQHTYANPLDIDYRYNFEQINEGVSYRTGADPAVVNHKGVYYLFMTLADGYWRSTNLIDWRFVTPSRWPMQSIVAPAAWSDGTRIVLEPSMMEPGAILSTTDPDSGKLDFWVRRMPDLPGSVNKDPALMKPGEVPPGPWDPALFKDDDGQWYLYWGSSNVFPMYGQKIAFDDGKLIYQTHAAPMLKLYPDRHGWERFGQDHCACWMPGKPSPSYMEGAWMTKHRWPLLSPVRSAGDRVQRLCQRRLHVGQAARAVHLRAVQSGGLSARGFRGRGGARVDVPGRRGQLVEHGDELDRLQLGDGAPDRDASGEILSPTDRWPCRRGSATFRIMCRRQSSRIRTSCLPAGCCCPTASRWSPRRRAPVSERPR